MINQIHANVSPDENIFYPLVVKSYKNEHLYLAEKETNTSSFTISIDKEINLIVAIKQVSEVRSPFWQFNLKGIFDYIVAILGLLLSSPISFLLTIAIKVNSKGPIVYCQERIGKAGKPFQLYKFRSMYLNSEPYGPQLARKRDKRVTPVGKFMRRFKLDEIPNFINVVKGDMSIVGPRPERNFYINRCVEQTSKFNQLLLIKPGITSLGQVKYGYASNVHEMLERMEFDLQYVHNITFFTDCKIILKTCRVILNGDGM